MQHETPLFIGGEWVEASSGARLAVENPATGETIGWVACADVADLDRALDAAARGFAEWRITGAFDRAALLRRAADLLRDRAEAIAPVMTREQGKPLAEALGEVRGAADMLDWLAEEARRSYGRIVPARSAGIDQHVIRDAIGPVAAFTPWNFPINQAVRKLGAAIATGCSIILKGPEETPASVAALVRALSDAGLPPGVVNLVFGRPAEISAHLIAHPVIRKVSFTGSTPVGRQLAALAGRHLKRITLELGGHAPVIVAADADLDRAAAVMAASKFRNAGQICIAPTRFLVEDDVHDAFVSRLVAQAEAIRVGDGLEPATTMGPLANERRFQAVERLVADALARGAELRTGGGRVGNTGSFFQPTVLTGMTPDMAAMNEEPFGPLALVSRVACLDDAVAEANRLDYGLAAYAFTGSARSMAELRNRVEAGMLSINHQGLALPELPFGGIKDSGQGSEGGSEVLEAYLNIRTITQTTL
ncbi:NAD-dependent succinate-semialdehyde dehydrogenase [uncultured Paracoccus sp.]|uniref:NAD-dependent succinate-semialdehyde dehydrogenase n=1 Tax=uncultured Paracoccus sp. TaxID=189685 RepID=UPI0025DB4BFD|nr:NAD-dependent succinate-semialdehyde dehydrogenase [uncultured Paracoccus sp.]